MIVSFGQAEFGVSVGTSGDGGQAARHVDTSTVAVWSTALCVWNGGGGEDKCYSKSHSLRIPIPLSTSPQNGLSASITCQPLQGADTFIF